VGVLRHRGGRCIVRDIERGELRAPARVIKVDLARAYGDEAIDVARFETAWCLVCDNGFPVAMRFLDIEAESSIALGELRDRFAVRDLPQPVDSVGSDDAPLTVVIATRDRVDSLMRTLASLTRQSDPRFEVLVVDNSSDGELARTLIDYDGLSLRCYHEPAPGASRARNCGLANVHTELIAWIDDDEEADPDWIAWLRRGFAHRDRPDAVAGVMLPAELESDAQVNFERYGGFHKGRGAEPVALRAGTPSVIDPLYPLPNFGAGGNLAFRTERLRAIGGYDNRLGTGTLTCGGEETRALSLLLETGSTILYWPPAVAWHYHRQTHEALQKQFYGYSAGLTAFYMSMILTSPKYIWRILRFVPRGLKRIVTNRGSGTQDSPTGDVPADLLRLSRKGLFQGAWLYLREVRRQRRAEPVHPRPELMLVPAHLDESADCPAR
jgi:glycosyltransferase involved in cell wall biosynthesis